MEQNNRSPYAIAQHPTTGKWVVINTTNGDIIDLFGSGPQSQMQAQDWADTLNLYDNPQAEDVQDALHGRSL